jgi:hypothetical protein
VGLGGRGSKFILYLEFLVPENKVLFSGTDPENNFFQKLMTGIFLKASKNEIKCPEPSK